MPQQPGVEKQQPLPAYSWCGPGGERFRWGGNSTCFCAACHQLFTSHYAFDAHQSGGECRDPATLTRPSDGESMFVRVDKPTWHPPYVWVRYVPGREPYSGPGKD